MKRRRVCPVSQSKFRLCGWHAHEPNPASLLAVSKSLRGSKELDSGLRRNDEKKKTTTSSARSPTANHPGGIDNPNRFFVFAVDFSDMPSYEAQQLAKRSCK
jgi:hypothetical protein